MDLTGPIRDQAIPALVGIGKTAWRAMEGNKLTVSASESHSVIPVGATFLDISIWRRSFVQLAYNRNHHLLPTVRVELNHYWKHSGQFRGKGRYIKDAAVRPRGKGRFGDTVNVDVSVGGPENETPTSGEAIVSLPFTIIIDHRELAIYEFKYKGDGSHELTPLTQAANEVRLLSEIIS